jgi:hypothetical protein
MGNTSQLQAANKRTSRKSTKSSSISEKDLRILRRAKKKLAAKHISNICEAHPGVWSVPVCTLCDDASYTTD